MTLEFSILKEDKTCRARLGLLQTTHGIVETQQHLSSVLAAGPRIDP
jgi:hypothetical protein